MKILAIAGSPRLKGNTNYLVDQALAEAAASGAETEKIVLSQHDIKPCLAHDDCAKFPRCKQNDDMNEILDKVCKADGVILATPVYYWDVSAQMKTFIDRNFFLYGKDQKAKARAVGMLIVAGGEGVEDALRSLNHYIGGTFKVGDDRKFVVSGFAGDAGEIKSNRSVVNEARKLGRDMVEALKKD
jgi:multimeric flavodoxin WrbA